MAGTGFRRDVRDDPDSPAFGQRQGTDPDTLLRHFGTADRLLPLWIAEPDVELAPEVVAALEDRGASGWYGYETRPDSVIDAFWDWMAGRHGWTRGGLTTLVSPSVGTSIGVLVERLTDPGDGVILQPPVFTDFKPLVTARSRQVVRNPLRLIDGRYGVDFEHLESVAADPNARMLILCSPHNPVGRVWTSEELSRVAAICSANDVFVLADEIHADLAIAPNSFVPFAAIASDSDVAWASVHGPIKTFGLAGVCDTLLITPVDHVAESFQQRSSQLHLTRNNVFGLRAFETAYRSGAPWLDDFLTLVADNVEQLRQGLPEEIELIAPEGTYLVWLDLRRLDLDVPEIPSWLGSRAGLALSPGHWFGREGAGFARMTIGVARDTVGQAIERLNGAVGSG